jgi:hypothetical protein
MLGYSGRTPVPPHRMHAYRVVPLQSVQISHPAPPQNPQGFPLAVLPSAQNVQSAIPLLQKPQKVSPVPLQRGHGSPCSGAAAGTASATTRGRSGGRPHPNTVSPNASMTSAVRSAFSRLIASCYVRRTNARKVAGGR